MEAMKVVNMMRTTKADHPLHLEDLHQQHGGKLYRGRPEMLVLRLSNARNIQLFRKGTVQILGYVTDDAAEDMRRELMQRCHITLFYTLLTADI